MLAERQQTPSLNSGSEGLPLGSVTPRLFTPPLVRGEPGPCGCGCALTPETSYGFDVEIFARDVLGEPLDPWQRWAAIHAGELLPDGRPRFRRLLLLLSRQSGKTFLLKVLALYWLFVEQQKLVVGMSTNLDYAREAWEKAVETAETVEELSVLLPSNGVRRTNGEQTLTTSDRCRYKIAASNRKGGRSLSIDRLISDELREQQSWDAYNAAYPAMNARPFGQAFFISNQGDDSSTVLNSLRDSAVAFIEHGVGDQRLGLMEWSPSNENCEIDDPVALAESNPTVGSRIDWDTLLGAARTAKLKGGEEEAGFRTEVLCQRVRKMNPAIEARSWAILGPTRDRPAVPLDGDLRSRLAWGWDVSTDGFHASIYAAAVGADGTVYLDSVREWRGANATKELRECLPGLLARAKPRVVGYLPTGPGAAVAVELSQRKHRVSFPPFGVKVEPIKAEVTAVCMGFAELVRTGGLLHSGDPLLTAQVEQAEKGIRGDAWVFLRPKDGWADTLYAAAAAVHLARALPPPLQVGEVLVVP